MTMTLEAVVEPSGTEAASLAWDGSRVIFSRPSDNELWQFEPDSGTVSLFRRFTGGVTGVASDGNGRVYGCQTLSRRIVTYEPDGSTSVLATHLDGRLHNFPRYAAVDRLGRVWFADPKLGLRPPGPQVFPVLDHASVLRLDWGADGGWTLARMTVDTLHPTVVALAADQSVLYVVDGAARGRQELRAYPIVEGGLGAGSALATFERADDRPPVTGMAVGPQDTVIVAGCGGVFAVTDDGETELLTELPAGATDVAIAGSGGAALYVTTGDGALLRGDVAA
jgi:gluconolactonase